MNPMQKYVAVLGSHPIVRTWQAYYRKLCRRSFHGTFRFLEIGEAILATAMYSLVYFFPGLEHFFHGAFVLFVGLLILTFLSGLLFAAYLSAKEMDQEIVNLNGQLVSKDKFGDERREMVRKQWATLDERQRLALHLILVFGEHGGSSPNSSHSWRKCFDRQAGDRLATESPNASRVAPAFFEAFRRKEASAMSGLKFHWEKSPTGGIRYLNIAGKRFGQKKGVGSWVGSLFTNLFGKQADTL